MSREVPEWIGRTDDTPIPDRVKDRVARRAGDHCQNPACKRKIAGKLRGEVDHIISIIIGGENRESNLQLLCYDCHKAKTSLDVKIKSKVARVRKRHLGLKSPPRNPMPGSRASKWKKPMNGPAVLRSKL